jgi:cellulose synthase/poly-beta-1,6-N-acetylglucosamine synthase-like glycosyltransferase
MELITLSMPVYNVEEYVARALFSALNQTYKNIEFIIVDDRDRTTVWKSSVELFPVIPEVNRFELLNTKKILEQDKLAMPLSKMPRGNICFFG